MDQLQNEKTQVQNSLVFIDNNEVVTDSLIVAEVFEKQHKDVLKSVRNLNCSEDFNQRNFAPVEYQDEKGEQRPKYLIKRDGLVFLVMGFTGKRAAEFKERYIQDFNEMEQKLKQQLDTSQLSPELQMFNQMFKVIANHELEQKQLKQKVQETERKVDSISEIVALNSTEWRKDTTTILNKIALKQGGFEMYRTIRNESYDILEQRANAKLSVRVKNKQKNMALEGVPKSRIDKVSKLDVIDEDKRLLEIYLAVVKEMAIRYQVNLNQAI
ncbi:Rha family transcriptional regulator [Bacillus luti]|uniref:Rha family transcriptional regulator n=1 Tax=Bacillus luti TaxID=2026191 RepID=UPI00289957AC|nr:Rha family transcriptional regulator [Bacillus luti]